MFRRRRDREIVNGSTQDVINRLVNMENRLQSSLGALEKRMELLSERFDEIRALSYMRRGILEEGFSGSQSFGNAHGVDSMLDRLQDQDDEFRLFDDVDLGQFARLIDSSNDVVLIGHWASLLQKNLIDKLKVNAQILSPVNNLHALRDLLKGKGLVVVMNVHLAAMLIRSPILSQIAEGIRTSLILPFRLPTRQMTVVWKSGFSVMEHSGNYYFRWACGSTKRSQIAFCSRYPKPLEVKLSWQSHSLASESTELVVSGLVRPVMFNLTDQSAQYELDVVIPSGFSVLNFDYIGPSFRPDGDSRDLNFVVADFVARSKDDAFIIRDEEAFDVDYVDDYYENDDRIRDRLHNSGFFEVSGYASYNHGNFCIPLPTSRYFHPDSYYMIDSESEDPFEIASKGEVKFFTGLYVANRRGTMKGGGYL